MGTSRTDDAEVTELLGERLRGLAELWPGVGREDLGGETVRMVRRGQRRSRSVEVVVPLRNRGQLGPCLIRRHSADQ